MKSSLIILCFLSVLTSCDYYVINPHHEAVGMIEKPFWGDDNDFKLCYEDKVFPYYYGRNPGGFTQSRDTLKTYFLENFDNKGYTNMSGYITVRFIINCNGEIGRFKLLQVGTDFKATKFSTTLTDHILELVSSLKTWRPIAFYDSDFDSYYHITLKITNGDIVEILS